jgi:hypothetical protein
LGDIRPGESVRLGQINESHVDRLAELRGEWPPILITQSGRIIDGHYRYLAARRLGHDYVDCVVFDGCEEEAFIEAVRSNSAHGLPLTLRERRTASRRILVVHPEWSDRLIASSCGLAHKTVGRIRADLTSGGEIRHLNHRRGRDGKVQPSVRTRVVAAPGERPRDGHAVRLVQAASAPSPCETGPGQELGPAAAELGARIGRGRRALSLSADNAFASTEAGRNFTRWFAGNVIADDWGAYISSVPRSRVYEIVDEARRRAEAWTQFAAAVAAKAQPRGVS